MKYLFIAEDFALIQSDVVPDECYDAYDQGLWDIVDMECGLQYIGNGNWLDIARMLPMTDKEIIEKLQDPNRAQPFGVLSSEEQGVLKRAGMGWTWRFNEVKCWVEVCTTEWCNALTYILKPDYKPEPEYEDCEIEHSHQNLMARGGPLSGPTSIHKLPARPEFVGFFEEDGQRTFNDLIANTIREGHKVIARFVKE